MADIAKVRRANRVKRHSRLRKKVHGTAERPRLAVHRSNKHVTAQLINDDEGTTLAAASTTEPTMRSDTGATIDAAAKVGELIAQRAQSAGIATVVFDRGGFRYHGRIAAIAEAARKAGLEF